MQGHPAFLVALDEIRAMHLKKGADYGAGDDCFANVRASERFGIPAWLGAVLRGNDKMARIQSFAVKGELKNEPLEDSLLDLANYAIIALVLWREQREQREANEKAIKEDQAVRYAVQALSVSAERIECLSCGTWIRPEDSVCYACGVGVVRECAKCA